MGGAVSIRDVANLLPGTLNSQSIAAADRSYLQ